MRIHINSSPCMCQTPHPQTSRRLPTPIIMAYCERCDRRFLRPSALGQHKESSRSHWLCHDCDIDFMTQDALRQHFIQTPSHLYCEECNHLFVWDVSRRQHMIDRHSYCRTHDQVSTPLYHQITYRNLLDVSSRNRSSNLNPTSICTTESPWITISASIARRNLGMKIRCGITQLRNTISVAPARGFGK
jgi:hypothetical protein